METHLSDMIIPEVFGNYVLNTALKTNRFVQSGILTPDPDLGPHLLEAGTKITVPLSTIYLVIQTTGPTLTTSL